MYTMHVQCTCTCTVYTHYTMYTVILKESVICNTNNKQNKHENLLILFAYFVKPCTFS